MYNSGIDFERAFGDRDGDSDLVRQVWGDLRVQWYALEASVSRSGFYMLAVASCFYLLGKQGIEEFTILGVKVTDLELVRLSLPLIFAYLMHVASIRLANAWWISDIYSDMSEHFYPGFYENDMEVAFWPVGSVGEATVYRYRMKSTLGAWTIFAGIFLRIALAALAPLAFEAYALSEIFQTNEGTVLLPLVVSACSAVLLATAIPAIWFVMNGLLRHRS